MTTELESADSRRRALLHPGTERVYPLPFAATVPELLRRAVERFGDLDLLVTTDERVTFAEIDRRSRLLARHLVAAGVGKGTRVAILLPLGPAWVEGFLALARIGALTMAVNTFLKPPELRRALRHADAQFLLVPERLGGRPTGAFLDEVSPGLSVAMEPRREARLPDLPYLRSAIVHRPGDLPFHPVDDELLDAMEAEVSPADWLVTVYTSGTTSEPKAVLHTHGTEVRHSANLVELRGLTPEYRMFAVLPFFWIGGLMYELLPALHSGSMIVCQERFDPAEALDLIEREQTNSFMGYANAREQIMSQPSYSERDLRRRAVPSAARLAVGRSAAVPQLPRDDRIERAPHHGCGRHLRRPAPRGALGFVRAAGALRRAPHRRPRNQRDAARCRGGRDLPPRLQHPHRHVQARAPGRVRRRGLVPHGRSGLLPRRPALLHRSGRRDDQDRRIERVAS